MSALNLKRDVHCRLRSFVYAYVTAPPRPAKPSPRALLAVADLTIQSNRSIISTKRVRVAACTLVADETAAPSRACFCLCSIESASFCAHDVPAFLQQAAARVPSPHSALSSSVSSFSCACCARRMAFLLSPSAVDDAAILLKRARRALSLAISRALSPAELL